MKFRKIDRNDQIQEIVENMNYNIRIYKNRKQEIDKLQEVNQKEQSQNKEKTINSTFFHKEVPINKEKKEEINQDFEDEILYYLQELENIENKDNIKEILPVKENYNYQNIMIRLIAESKKIMNSLIEMYNENIAKENLVNLKERIQSQKNILDTLYSEIKEKKEQTKQTDIKQNNLIFVPMKSGKIRVLDEIANIDSDYYDKFLDLFQSIKDGTFKSISRLFGDNLSSMCEVKGNAVRIIFQRLDYDNYAIVTAFIKKTTNDQGYLDSITNKVLEYKKIKPILKNNIQNEEFCSLHKKYEEELFAILNTKTKGLK